MFALLFPNKDDAKEKDKEPQAGSKADDSTEPKSEPKLEPKPVPKQEPTPQPVPEPKPEPGPEVKLEKKPSKTRVRIAESDDNVVLVRNDSEDIQTGPSQPEPSPSQPEPSIEEPTIPAADPQETEDVSDEDEDPESMAPFNQSMKRSERSKMSVTGLSSLESASRRHGNPTAGQGGMMFAWPTWDKVYSAEPALMNTVGQVRAQDRWMNVGNSLQKPTMKTGEKLQKMAIERAETTTGSMTYGQMIKGFLVKGETPRFIGKSGHKYPATLSLDSTEVSNVKIDTTGMAEDILLKRYPRGEAIITNERLLLFSCEPDHLAEIQTVGNPEQGRKKGHVSIKYGARTTIWYKPIPLANLRSIEILIKTGNTCSAQILKPTRCGAPCNHPCFVIYPYCCGNYYQERNVAEMDETERCVIIHYEGEAWGEKKMLKLKIDADVEIDRIQDWSACLQLSSEKMYGVGLLGADEFAEDAESRQERLQRLQEDRVAWMRANSQRAETTREAKEAETAYQQSVQGKIATGVKTLATGVGVL